MSSLHLGKKFQCHNKVSKRFAKFTRAVKKTPRRIVSLLSSTLSPSRNKSFPDTTYASINSLYECPCNYHVRKREELERRLANHGGEGKGDAKVLPEPNAVVSDHDTESESESENENEGDVVLPAVERRMDEIGKECLNERAERFIESFREDQKLQRQRSVHD